MARSSFLEAVRRIQTERSRDHVELREIDPANAELAPGDELLRLVEAPAQLNLRHAGILAERNERLAY